MTNNKGQFYNEQTGAFANQTITIMQRVAGDQYREAYVAACQLLSPPALKMYGYACLDAEGYKRVWKRQDFEIMGLTSSAYYRGLQELKELGYIDNGVFNPGAVIEKSKTDNYQSILKFYIQDNYTKVERYASLTLTDNLTGDTTFLTIEQPACIYKIEVNDKDEDFNLTLPKSTVKFKELNLQTFLLLLSLHNQIYHELLLG